MEKFKFLSHTADIKFQAFGDSLEDCFENAVYALKEIICKNKVKEKTEKEIIVEGKDLENLLYNFLEEFLFLLETDGFLINKISDIEIEGEKPYKLTCIVKGDNIKNYDIETHVKAVTYNDMFVKQKNKWVCQVVVDV